MRGALADRLFRPAHPGHWGLRVGGGQVCFAEEYLVAIDHTSYRPARLYRIAQLAVCSLPLPAWINAHEDDNYLIEVLLQLQNGVYTEH